MGKDLLAHHPRLRSPAAAIGWVAGLYLLTTIPMTFVSFDENWRRPVQGMILWMLAWVVLALPLTAIATALAVRVEQAATGVRHPQRAGWAGVALGVMLAAHWALHLLWSPAYMLWVLTENYRREDHVVGAVVAGVAWVFALAGVGIARIEDVDFFDFLDDQSQGEPEDGTALQVGFGTRIFLGDSDVMALRIEASSLWTDTDLFGSTQNASLTVGLSWSFGR